MTAPTVEPDRTRCLVALFDRLASGYDHPALRFFPFVADYLVHTVHVSTGAKVLDLATGTGAVSLAAAQRVGPGGRIMAVDLSEAMLARQAERIERHGVDNVDLHVMDAAQPEFRGSYFHFALCSFALFMLPDMEAALRQWLRVLRPGGRLAFTTFATNAFQPLQDRFFARLQSFAAAEDLQLLAGTNWSRLNESEQCVRLLQAAGAEDIAVEARQFGYHLGGAEDWWAVLCNSGFRALLDLLDAPTLEDFRRAHLAEIAELAAEEGIWLDVPVLIATASRPS